MPLKRSLSHGDNGDNDWTAQVAFTCEDPPAEKRIKQETPPPRISIRIPPHSQLQSQSRPRSPTLSAQIHHTARHRARIAPLTDTLPCHHNPAPFKHILSSIPQSNIIRIAGHLPPQPLLSDTDSLPPKQLLSDSDSLLSPSSNCPTPSSALPSPHSVLHPPPRLQVHNAQKRLFNLLHRDSLMPQPTLSERLRGLIEECISWLEAVCFLIFYTSTRLTEGTVRLAVSQPHLIHCTRSPLDSCQTLSIRHAWPHRPRPSPRPRAHLHSRRRCSVSRFKGSPLKPHLTALLLNSPQIKNDAHKPLYMLAIEDMAVWATKELPWAITELHDGRLILKHDIVVRLDNYAPLPCPRSSQITGC